LIETAMCIISQEH